VLVLYDHINRPPHINYWCQVTDLAARLEKKKKSINIDSYFKFVEAKPKHEKVYLLTDNHDTQKLFLDKYGDQIIVYERIPKFNPDKLSQPIEEDHRFTTIEHTIIDVLIASHSKNFKPAIFSSLSDLVRMFSHIGRRDRGWCKHREGAT
jgi:hypothetical protein